MVNFLILLFVLIMIASGAWQVFLVVVIGLILVYGLMVISANQKIPEKRGNRIDDKLNRLKRKYSDDIEAEPLMKAARAAGVENEDDLAIWAKSSGKNVDMACRLYRRAKTEEHKKALAEYENKKAALETERAAVEKSIAGAKQRKKDKAIFRLSKVVAESTGHKKYLWKAAMQLEEAEKKREGKLTPESELKALRQVVADVKSHIIDDIHPEKYFKMLRFGNHEIIAITPGGSADVGVPISVEGSPTVLGKPAIIDGSLCVTAYVDGKEFARGCLIARGGGETNLKMVGFGDSSLRKTARSEYVLLVPLSDSESFKKNTVCELRFSPSHLWAIQA